MGRHDLFYTENWPYLFYILEKLITQFKTTTKIIGHHTGFQRSDDLPL